MAHAAMNGHNQRHSPASCSLLVFRVRARLAPESDHHRRNSEDYTHPELLPAGITKFDYSHSSMFGKIS